MHRYSLSILRLVALLAMILPLFIAISPLQRVEAAVANGRYVWSSNVKDVGAEEVITHANGSVTIADCSTATPQSSAKTVNALGILEGKPVSHTSGTFCDEKKAADGTGAVYGVHYDGVVHSAVVVAYRHGVKLWERKLAACGSQLSPRQLVLGADGNLHVLTEEVSGCSARVYLARLRLSDGTGGLTPIDHQVDWMSAYRDGLILNGPWVLDYRKYDGTQVSRIKLQEYVHAIPRGPTADGRIYFEVLRGLMEGEDSCGDTRERSRTIVGYGPDGKVFNYDLPSCSRLFSMAVASNGTVVYAANDKTQERYVLRSIKPDGSSGASHTLTILEGKYTFKDSPPNLALRPDAKGNIVFSREYGFNHGEFGSRSGHKFEVRDPVSLEVKSQFFTDQIDPVSTFELAGEGVGLAEGMLYFTARKCDSEQCQPTSPRLVYAITMAVGMDSPRGTVLAGQSMTKPICPSLLFIGARGSGEPADSQNGLGNTVGDVQKRLALKYPHMKTMAVDYSAVRVGYGNRVGYPAEYSRSKEGGKKNLVELLNYVASVKCPSTGLVGVGFSQGADVVGDVFGNLLSANWLKRVRAVVLLGDPRFNPKQTVVNVGTYDKKESGIAGSPRLVASKQVSRTRSYCVDKDPVCSFNVYDAGGCIVNPSACMHARYVSAGWTRKASDWLVNSVK